MSEFMMMGLRLTREGVSASEFEKRFERRLNDVFGKETRELLQVGLLESLSPQGRRMKSEGKVLRLTERGRLLGNQVFMRFVGE